MRSQPVDHPHILDCRVTIFVCLAAGGLTIRWFQGVDLSSLVLTYPTWPREPWRLLTACLLHASWLHLLFNLYWTWRFGQVVEPIFGWLATAGIYVLLGAAPMAAEWAFLRGGVGLSGVGYGLFGLLWALARFHPDFRRVMDPQTTRLFVGWFFFCVAATFLDWLPVANIAHGAGALLGGLLGMSLSPFRVWRIRGRTGLVGLLVTIALLSTVFRPFVNFGPQRAWELAWDGYQALVDEDYERAARLYEESVARDPDFAHSWHNLGVAYYELGRDDEAVGAIRREKEILARPPAPAKEEPSFRDWQDGFDEILKGE